MRIRSALSLQLQCMEEVGSFRKQSCAQACVKAIPLQCAAAALMQALQSRRPLQEY